MTGKKRKTVKTVQRFCETCGQPLPEKKRSRAAAGITAVRAGAANAAVNARAAEKTVRKYYKRALHLKKLINTIGKLL